MLDFLFGDRGDANPDFDSAFLEATEVSEIEQEIEVHQGFKKTAKSSAERAESEQIIATLEGRRALLIGPEMGNKRVGQIAAAADDVVVPDNARPLGVAAKPASRESGLEASLPYLRETYKSGQYATAKAFYKALESKAGTAESPFDKGIGQYAGSLFVRATRSTLAANTLANQFWPIRNQA